MPLFAKESLETLRHKVDLVEVLSPHIDLKPSGSSYKALCPFHDEKSPSFTVQRGDSHYHCFGCGAHGDAIQFLMNYQNLSFSEAVESLASQFSVHLDTIEKSDQPKGPSKQQLKSALEKSCTFFEFCLLHTEEGHVALNYLYNRGLTLDFIRKFRIGLSPQKGDTYIKYMREQRTKDSILSSAGLVKEGRYGAMAFFSDRIMFPIQDGTGSVIGFSGRKYKEETFGGKYVNSPETPLFKKSRVLFGEHFSRRRIAKDKRVIIVEGQIDALRLIDEGLNFTVAGQGTAFGEGHAEQIIKLGATEVFLAMDSDNAGIEAARKIGDIFQSKGLEVFVVSLPKGKDPDTILLEEGVEAFTYYLKQGQNYLSFLVGFYRRQFDMRTPAGKNEIVKNIMKQLRGWENEIMYHESVKQISHLLDVPENLIQGGNFSPSQVYVKRYDSVDKGSVDPNRVIEADLIRWMMLYSSTFPEIVSLVSKNIQPDDLKDTLSKKVFEYMMERENVDMLEMTSEIQDETLPSYIESIMEKRINPERALESLTETLQKILDRNWMQRREEVKVKIHSGQMNDEELLKLAKEFDDLNKNPPKVAE